ncbi:MAG TPA: DUF2784 domain-containing protein [Nitrospirota bacterium]|nr:DUF2784 domain-containing protein [Nitrospirota bacterium]
MLYRVLADIVVLVHLLWILFLIIGAYWGRKNGVVMLVQSAGFVFAVTSQIFGWYCPLTHVEVWLREKQGTAGVYPGSFIAHYAEQLVYADVSPTIIFALTIALIIVNVWIYTMTFRKTKTPI